VTDGGPRRAAPARRFAEAPPPEAAPSPDAAPARAPQPEPPAYAAAPEPPQDAAAAAPSPPRGGKEGRGEGEAPTASRAPSAPSSAAARAQATAPPDPVSRYDELRRAGLLRGEIRTFPGCDGEPWRKLERDPDGRIVSYAREGLSGDRRVRVEAIYDLAGAPARVTVKDAATSEPLMGTKPWVPHAAEADGPPRCARGAN
jgi:hypothetical protein